MSEDKKTPTAAENEAQDEQPKYVTAEDLNRAISARERRQESKIEKMLAEQFAKFGQSLEKPAQEAQPAQPDNKSDAASYEAKLKHISKQLEDERVARQEAETRRAREEENRMLTDALASRGITGARQKAAMALLREEGRLSRDASGKVTFKMPRDGYDDQLDVDSGIEEWTKGDGKEFMPPRPVAGSGAEAGKGPGRQPGKYTKEDMGIALADWVTSQGFNIK